MVPVTSTASPGRRDGRGSVFARLAPRRRSLHQRLVGARSARALRVPAAAVFGPTVPPPEIGERHQKKRKRGTLAKLEAPRGAFDAGDRRGRRISSTSVASYSYCLLLLLPSRDDVS